MLNTKRRVLLLQVVAVICAFLSCCIATFVSWNAKSNQIPSVYYDDLSMPENSISILNNVKLQAKNSRISNGVIIHARKPDAQLYLYLKDEQTIQSIAIVLQRSFTYDVSCALFYPNAWKGYDEDHKEVFILPKGKKAIYFTVPMNEYTEFRLDIDETYRIDNILVSKEMINGIYVTSEALKPLSMFIYFLIILSLFEVLVFFRIEIMYFVKYLRLKRKRIGIWLLIGLTVLTASEVLGYYTFKLSQNYYSWFWMVIIGFTSLLICYQIIILSPKKHYDIDREKRSYIHGVTYWSLIALMCVFVMFEYYEALRQNHEFMMKLRFRYVYLFAFIELISLALLYWKAICQRNIETVSYLKIYIYITLILSIGYLMVFLPFVSPDEMSHYLSAYRMSNIFMGQIGQIGEERLIMRMEDYMFFEQRSVTLGSGYYIHITESMHPFTNAKGLMVVDGPMVTNAIFSYAFSGLGITLARIMNLSGLMTFYVGRLANLLFFLIVLYHLMKKIPFGKTALFVIATMPMMLQLASTYSYDVTTICFVGLFVVQVLNIAYSKEKLTRREIELCLFYAILVGPSKLVFIPVLFLVMIIPMNRLGRHAHWKKLGIIGIGVLSAAVVMLASSMISADSALREMVENNVENNMLSWIHEQGYTISWILRHPAQFILIYIRTFILMADHYFFTMIGNNLGWLDIPIPQIYCVIVFIMLIVGANIKEERLNGVTIRLNVKIWTALVCLASVMLTMLAMLLNWTPLSYDYITGVQGRYFIPLLIPAILFFSNDQITIDGMSRSRIAFVSAALNTWICIYVFTQSIVQG